MLLNVRCPGDHPKCLFNTSAGPTILHNHTGNPIFPRFTAVADGDVTGKGAGGFSHEIGGFNRDGSEDHAREAL